MEVPRLEVESELQLPTYATAAALWDLSHVFNLHHSSWQLQILNPLSEARDQTSNLMVPCWIRFRCATTGTLRSLYGVWDWGFLPHNLHAERAEAWLPSDITLFA